MELNCLYPGAQLELSLLFHQLDRLVRHCKPHAPYIIRGEAVHIGSLNLDDRYYELV